MFIIMCHYMSIVVLYIAGQKTPFLPIFRV